MKTPDINKIPVSEVKRVTRTFHGKQKKIMWRGLELTVRRLLSPAEVMRAVDAIFEMCSNEDDIKIAMLDFAFRVAIVSRYASIELPDDIEELNFIMYETDLYDKVKENINKDQLASIRYAVGL